MPQHSPRTSCTASRQTLFAAPYAAHCRNRRLIAGGFGLVAEFLAVAPGVGAERVRERRRAIDAGEGDVVGELAFCRIERRRMTDAFGNFVIGTRRITADPKSADASLIAIERDAAAER